MAQFIRLVFAFALAALLAACGGGGGSSGTSTGDSGTKNPTASAAVATIDVTMSATYLSSTANSSISFTVLPKDANNQAVPNQPVTFSASSGNLNGALPAPSTGSKGEPVTGVTLSPGANQSNRVITVTVTSGTASTQVSIPVKDTKLTLSGNSFVLQGGTTSFTAKAVDSAGLPISGATLTVASALSNTVSPASITTDAQGGATFDYTGSNAGQDRLTVSGLGASTTADISVSSDQFSFISPSSNTSVVVGANQVVTVQYLKSGVPQVGKTVTFSTTRGTITPSSGVTDALGQASATLTSSSAGTTSVVAQTGSSQVTLPMTVVATNPSTLVLQANPGAVAPNLNGSTSNQVTLSATVRDSAGNPVAGQVVNFTSVVDQSAGNISPPSAKTDSSGTATTVFYPGGGTTANNGVQIKAVVLGTAVQGTTYLTVNTQALFISITTGNTIGSLDENTYKKDFSVQVVDANGAPVANKVVNLAAVPDYYYKGSLAYTGSIWEWDSSVNTAGCPNEDTNRNGFLDSGEDKNGNGSLEPGLPVSLSASSVTTAENGMATFSLHYGENYVPWMNVILTARTAVGGTESVKTYSYFLVGSASDMTSKTAPAGYVSPFGAQGCDSKD